MLRSIIQRHLLVQRARRFLNKNPIHLLRLEYLHKLFPDARFVYIVRDPLATVLSHYRMVQRIAAVIHPHPQARQAVEQGLHLDVLTPRIKTRQYAETLALEHIHPLLGIAHQWRMMNLTALASLQANPALARQTLQITYEALTRDPSAVLDQVWRFVGLDDAACRRDHGNGDCPSAATTRGKTHTGGGEMAARRGGNCCACGSPLWVCLMTIADGSAPPNPQSGEPMNPLGHLLLNILA